MIKILKLVLISVLVFFGLLLAITAMMPSTVRISRAVDTHAPPERLRDLITDLTQWERWNEYARVMTDKQVSATEINSREMKISRTGASGMMIHTDWTQASGKTYPGVFNIISGDSATVVQWYFDVPVKWYPWEKLGSIIYDKQIGPVMQVSLKNLKELAEE